MNLTKSIKPNKQKLKICCFKGCNVLYLANRKSKYCEEHKKKQYYKELYIDKYKEIKKIIVDNSNQNIKHHNCNCVDVKLKCKLEGCQKSFILKLIPSVYIYPKYCEEHRNEYKRNKFIKEHNETIN